jgi:hypothetical protein
VEVVDCIKCGSRLPPLALGSICGNCLNDRYGDAMLTREREAWSRARPRDVALSHTAKGKLIHLVLGVDSTRTYCGQHATELRKRRRHVKLDALPDGLCTDCLSAFDVLRETCALRA